MTTNQAIASNGNDAQAANTATANPSSGDYINHYLAGNPILYIWQIASYPNKSTGDIQWYYKANMKIGPKDGNHYVPIEGSLSPNAVKALEPVFEFVNAKNPELKRSVGVKVKAPRFEGVNAFMPKGAEEGDSPVGVARFRLNRILDMRLFKKSAKSNSETSPPNGVLASKNTPEFGDKDIPF